VTIQSARLPAGQQSVRDHNLTLVLASLADHRDGLSRAQLSALTGLTRATVGALGDDLIGSGLVVESEPRRGGRGRPGSPLSLNPSGPAGLGIEINVDYVSACVIDLTGAVRATGIELIDNRESPPEPAVRAASVLARRVAIEAALPIAGIGLALPGLVDERYVLRRAPNLAGWVDVDVAPMLRFAFGPWASEVSVRVDNEANLAALAQLWYGEPSHPPDFVHVSGEVGIGAGVVLRGQLFRGGNGYAGEIGHVIVDPTGPACHCGSRGCLEQVAGKEAMLELAGSVTLDQLWSAAQAGDPRALTSLQTAGAAIGTALVSVLNVIDIHAVVLGGIYARFARWLTPPVMHELTRRVSAPWTSVEVVASSLGDDAAVRGAAGLVVHDVLANERLPTAPFAVT
jgi:predicted NBD/HSP70 family sugar kinase